MVLTGKSETCCVTSLEIYALDLVTKDTHRIPDPHKQASAVSVSGPFPLCLCAEIGNQGISCADKLLSMKKTHGFSGPHEGYAGCNPHESLCWIKSSPLRQLVLKYWNGWNCLKKKKKKLWKALVLMWGVLPLKSTLPKRAMRRLFRGLCWGKAGKSRRMKVS